MNGRENKKDNDLFFLCSLIEYIARKTQNHNAEIVNKLGKKELMHILELADVYHSENIDKITENLIEKHQVQQGNFDITKNVNYTIPTHWDIGKVYKRLILKYSKHINSEIIDALIEVYNSWIAEKIDNYNSSMYYENEDFIFQSFLSGKVLI